MSAGKQEAPRWSMRAFHTRPTVAVIEPPTSTAPAHANTPFGFARELLESPSVDELVDAAWDGQGL